MSGNMLGFSSCGPPLFGSAISIGLVIQCLPYAKFLDSLSFVTRTSQNILSFCDHNNDSNFIVILPNRLDFA